MTVVAGYIKGTPRFLRKPTVPQPATMLKKEELADPSPSAKGRCN